MADHRINVFTIQLRNALSRFPRATMGAILREVQSPDDLQRACKRLGLPVSATPSQQIRILADAIETEGPGPFLARWTRAPHPGPPEAKLASGDGKGGNAGACLGQNSSSRQGGEDMPIREIKHISKRYADASPDDYYIHKPPGQGPTSEQTENPQPPPASETEDATWPEIDRRSGRERRSGDDRRGRVDVIYKNRRYGGDRRSRQDRRKVDSEE